jgi:hypothetical protein
MNPSIALAAALAAGSLSLPASAQSAAAPSHSCAHKDGAPSQGGQSLAPLFDAASDVLEAPAWAKVDASGAKLDSETCHLLAADGHELTRTEVEVLTGKPASKAPPAAGKDAKGLGAAQAVVAGATARGAAGSYEDSKQRFDGAAPGGGSVTEVGAEAGRGVAGLPPESRLSGVLNADLQKKYSEEEAGRALVAHFTSPDGAVRLPGVVLTDLGGAEMAAFDREHGIIKLNRTEAAKAVFSSAPEAEQTAALTRRLADPAKLATYLVEHPEARAALLDQQAGTFFHETFHAWQARRDPPIDAVEGKDPVEWEREAFREELHFFHERVMRDPSLADRAQYTDMDMYKRLLGGYPQFKEYTTELYQNSFGSSDFPTVEQTLAKRSKAVAAAGGAAAGALGAANALSTLRQVDSDYQKREADFAANVLPSMQAEAYPMLIARQMSAGRPIEALALATSAPEDIRRESGPKASEAVMKFLMSDNPSTAAGRMDAWDAYLAYQTKTTGSNLLPTDVFLRYARDHRAAVEQRLADAAKARRKQDRQDDLDWAKVYAQGLPDSAALLKRIEAASQTASR